MPNCSYEDCVRPASHWVVRHLAAGYLPNPDARAYCEPHRVLDLAAIVAATRAPVESAEIVEIRDALRA